MKSLIFLLMFAAMQGPGPAVTGALANAPASGPAIVGTPAFGENGNSSILSLATNAVSHTAGDAIVVLIRNGGTGTTITAPTNTAGDTFVHAAGTYLSASSTIDIWYTCNTAGNASDVVTANFSGSNFNAVFAVEVSGQSISSCLDTTQTGTTGAGTATITSSSFTPNAHALVLAIGTQNCAGGAWTAGSGYTILQNASTPGISIEGLTNAAATSQTASMTFNSACTQGISLASFK